MKRTQELLERGYAVSSCCGDSVDLVTTSYNESCLNYCGKCHLRCKASWVGPEKKEAGDK